MAVKTTMQKQIIMPPAKSQLLCNNFGCPLPKAPGWSCCDNVCGYQHQRDMAYIRNVLNGRTEWNSMPWGIGYWTVEKYLYYLTLTNNYAK